jgi:hypothetical protein
MHEFSRGMVAASSEQAAARVASRHGLQLQHGMQDLQKYYNKNEDECKTMSTVSNKWSWLSETASVVGDTAAAEVGGNVELFITSCFIWSTSLAIQSLSSSSFKIKPRAAGSQLRL